MRSILLIGLVVGCAGAEAMPAPHEVTAAAATQPVEAGFNPGETMAFEISIGGVLAGDAQLAVGEVGLVAGHRHVRVKSRAETAGAVAMVKHIVDEATTELDLETGHPISFDTVVETGDKHTFSRGTFTGNHADVTYSRDPETPTEVVKPTTYTLSFGKMEVHDAHSAMAQIRNWRPAVGSARTLYVMGGKRLWRVDLVYVGTDTIGTAVGNRAVVKLTGQAFRARGNLSTETTTPTRVFTVYLSDDADRVPLRVVGKTELGDIVMALTEYTRP